MLLKFVLAVLLAVAAYTASGADDVKCVPMQWTGVAVGKIGAAEAKKDPYVVTMYADVYADYEKKMEAGHEQLFDMDNKHLGNLTYIKDGKKMVTYYIDPMKMTCITSKVPAIPVQRLCSNSTGITHVGSLSVGGKMVDMYNRRFKEGDDTFTVVRDSFTLVNVAMSLKTDGRSELIALNYGNITKGVTDDSVFDIPKYCK